MRVLKIFIDGFGLGENKPELNPVVAANTPCFDYLLSGPLCGSSALRTKRAVMIPLDATLGVPGIPQSATGQTTLWTGINAAKAVGHHVRAFPTTPLREIIAEHSIFKTLTALGYRATFANAFTPIFFQLVESGKRHFSASTLSAMAADLHIRGIEELAAGKAVYQDITNEVARGRGANVPAYTPVQAGKHLAGIAQEYDFTLFEFFQSDLAGHKQDRSRCIALVEQLDAFLRSVLDNLDLAETLILLTSDHGNMEDISIKTHTTNPVPALLIGNYSNLPYHNLKSIEDITPFILEVIRKY